MISEEDMRKLLAACAGKGFYDRRDAALFRVAFDTGLRRAELAGLAVEDVDDEHAIVSFIGKGQRAEVAYLGAKSVAALDRYMRTRRVHSKAALTVERTPGEFVHPLWLTPMGPLHPQSLQRILEKRAELAGIARHLHMHSFRHGFAHAMKVAGASDEDIQRLGRWRDPRMMLKYGRAARDERARATHRRLSPGDRV
jgi:site-specific recombinase XerD